MTPWLSVVIPTIGRDTLADTILSYSAQVAETDDVEVLVVGDSNGGVTDRLVWAEHLCEDLGARYINYAGDLRMVGQPQRNAGQRLAHGDWIAFSQDDNVSDKHALEAIAAAVAQQDHPRPMFFRWLAPWRELIWRVPVLELTNIDADCLVIPRRLAGSVTWGMRYQGDFDACHSAMLAADGDVAWRQEVISIARPSAEHLWWKSKVEAVA